MINSTPIYDFIYNGQYAKYHKLREQELRFNHDGKIQLGDIIEIINPSQYKYKTRLVVGTNNELISMNTNHDDIHIPLCICSKLDNCIAFYSKLLLSDDEHCWKFTINNDDKYILHRFGGALSDKYQDITLHFRYNKLETFDVTFNDGIGTKTFNTESWNYSNEDIDSFYNIRSGTIWNKEHETNSIMMEIHCMDEMIASSVKRFPSEKWEYISKPLNDEYSSSYCYWREYLIGPRDEENKMCQMYESLIGTKLRYWKHSVADYISNTQICNLPFKSISIY